MGHLTWMNLPLHLRRGIANRLNQPATQVKVRESIDGDSAGFTGTVVTRGGYVFIKAIQTADAAVSARRREVRTNRFLPGSAPRILWQLESMEWLVVAYEYVGGAPADLRPGSPDLVQVLAALREVTEHSTDQITQFESLAARWDRIAPWRTMLARGSGTPWQRQRQQLFVDMEEYTFDLLSMGTTVAHTDIHEQNIRTGPHGARLLGWGWCCTAPAWVDPAAVVVRLITAGHAPAQAEAVMSTVPAWNAASADALTAFAVSLYGVWSLRSRWPHLTECAQRYAAFRLDRGAA
jgi:hypothetical protein